MKAAGLFAVCEISRPSLWNVVSIWKFYLRNFSPDFYEIW